MNEKGFGLVAAIAFVGFVALAVVLFNSFMSNVLGLTGRKTSGIPNYKNEYREYMKAHGMLMSSSNSSNSNSYSDIENKVETATIKYINNYYTLYEDDPLYIKVSSLISYGYLNSITDNSGNYCSGYTKVLKLNNTITYDSYIKCGSYQTSGYIERLDG